MPIQFRCSACQRMLSIARRKAGTRIGCPKCGISLIVPSRAGEPAQPATIFERADFERQLDASLSTNAAKVSPVITSPVAEDVIASDGEDEFDVWEVDGVVIPRHWLILLAVVLPVLLGAFFALGFLLGARLKS